MEYVPRLLEQIYPNENVIFRGHSNKRWGLIPSIGRYYSGPWGNVLELEKRSLFEFKKRAIPYLKYQPKSDIEWLCLMQHHGLATRLLDFTINPLIALFFATDPTIREDGELIIATYGRTYESIDNDTLFDRKHNFAFHPPHLTERIIGQQGCFVYNRIPNKELDGKQIEKIAISISQKHSIRSELQRLGITNSLLFPGIDGVCNDLNEKLVIDLLVKEIPF